MADFDLRLLPPSAYGGDLHLSSLAAGASFRERGPIVPAEAELQKYIQWEKDALGISADDESARHLLPAFEAAAKFAVEEYRRLDLPLNAPCVVAGVTSTAQGITTPLSGGMAYPSRSFGLGLKDGTNPIYAACVAVHELAHACGCVRFLRSENAGGMKLAVNHLLSNDSAESPGLSPYQYGWGIYPTSPKLEGVPLFSFFEEMAASALQRRFLAEAGWRPGSVLMPILIEAVASDVLFQKQLDIQIRCLELWESMKDENEIRFVDPASEERHLKRASGYIRKEKLLASYASYGTDIYGFASHSLGMLAAEILPEVPANEAFEGFCDDLIRAQVTGNLRPVLSRVRSALGADGIRFFQFALPQNNIFSSVSFVTLAGLFASARFFPEEECLSIRHEISILAQDARLALRDAMTACPSESPIQKARAQEEKDLGPHKGPFIIS